MRIIFIGGGNMAEAIFARLNNTTVIIVVQRNLAKCAILAAKYTSIKFLPELNFIPQTEDIVILAIKPQDAMEACRQLPKSDATIVSVMAGIATHTLVQWLNNKKIVRVISNTSASVGLAVNGIYFSPEVPAKHTQLIETIFAGIGKNYIFDNEDFINKIIPIAASAPAYIFYFIEAMIDTAINQFGFDKDDARNITLQVVKGSLAMIQNNPDLSINQLRANVTSKKGTTEKAINVFESINLKQVITNAEVACYNRALELGKTISKD